MGWADAEVSLTLVSDRAMARLNRETFGRRGPTNVIAFPVDRPEDGGGGRMPAGDHLELRFDTFVKRYFDGDTGAAREAVQHNPKNARALLTLANPGLVP